jgi:hypothetical protein
MENWAKSAVGAAADAVRTAMAMRRFIFYFLD